MKLEPFNLSSALYGDPVVTRDGKKVIEIHTFHSKHLIYPVIAIIEGYSTPSSFTKEGNHLTGTTNELDLFMAPKTEKRFVNIYQLGMVVYAGGTFETKEEALKANHDGHKYLTTIEVDLRCAP